ncbi:adenosylmethionine-8-amino-7-oxononanoate aminotransferase [Sulfobacillus thermosulfidooxidans DSM 9293]|uniref:Adenosylmethionine-8-amino-7-oxononanoate aminotransferase n=1 Tax=Sulfobacillus thermosulfidooxidans (strain DSM 9293 / VKM B-1269 / AT-1) TaxID=929705 RepID=A0A1W1WL08_SULTA|nr:adenosylmethionine--8-amino-7-oxononanoate transaminase [Sulfobacillus thermosulfidooxidans]SMC06998.1 adenosylmethionine-8-amino-7-oxononanoate aminotransferase [Sulfobacillus thermosulfidooxidans DSM 9293]
MDYSSITPDEIRRWDQQHVWHPFTPMKDYDHSDPVIIQAAQGVKVQDIEGRWYYDGVSSVWLNVHGHHVPELDHALIDQLSRVAHTTLLGQGNVPITVLAHRLSKIMPGHLTRFFFSESGASAVEVALKMAVQYWANQGQGQKTKIMGFTSNYHGDTLGAMAVAPDDIFHWPFLSYLPKEPRAPYPYCYRCPLQKTPDRCHLACLDLAESVMRAHQDELAAVIIEPVQGAGGIIPAPPGYLAGLRDLCTRYDVLLIVDEVATGIGRTGKWWATSYEEISPDILCMGKGLSGGYLPISATAATEDIYRQFYGRAGDRTALYHGHSYAGNQLAANVALANLELISQNQVIENVAKQTPDIASALDKLRPLPYVGDIRQKGFMIGIELVQNKEQRTPFPYAAQAGRVVQNLARQRGMLIRPIGNVVIFMPPLASSSIEIREMVDILCEAVVASQPLLEDLL